MDEISGLLSQIKFTPEFVLDFFPVECGLLSQIKFTPEFVLDFFPVEYGYDRG